MRPLIKNSGNTQDLETIGKEVETLEEMIIIEEEDETTTIEEDTMIEEEEVEMGMMTAGEMSP